MFHIGLFYIHNNNFFNPSNYFCTLMVLLDDADMFISNCGMWNIYQYCNIKSLRETSSKDFLNSCYNCVGSFSNVTEIPPPLSNLNRSGKLPITTLRTVVSKDISNYFIFQAKTFTFITTFINVRGFPHFVYPTNATLTKAPRFYHAGFSICCLSILSNFFFN